MKTLKFCAAAFLIVLTISGFSCATAEEGSDIEIETTNEPLILMPELRMPEVGEAAPVFEITTPDGKAYNFQAEGEGKVVSIVFWSLFCAPCRRSMPILNDLYKELEGRDFEILAINMDGQRMLEGVKNYVAEEGFEITFLMDEYDGESLKVADPYGVQGTPTTYLIDKDGIVAFSKAGDVERDELKALVLAELEKPRRKKEPEK
jgi:thiol-disulfide isomerase/thioredoxin